MIGKLLRITIKPLSYANRYAKISIFLNYQMANFPKTLLWLVGKA